MSGNTSGALGFVQGLQGGMNFADERRRNKLIDQTLAKKNYLTDLDIQGRREKWEGAGNDPAEFPEFEDPTAKDPLAVRGFNWLKSKFGGGSKPEVTAGVTPAVEPGQDEVDVKPQAIPTGDRGVGAVDTGFRGMVSGMADGGKVYTDEERMKRSYGDSYVTEEEAAANRAHREALPPSYQSPYSPYMREQRGRLAAGRKAIPTSGGGFGEAVKDVGRSIAGYFDDTTEAAQDTGAAYEAIDEFNQAEGARAKGSAARGALVETGKQMAGTIGGLAKDVFVDNPITQGILGFVGFDGTTDNRQPDPSTPPAGANVTDEGEDPKQQAIANTGPTEKPADAVAKEAVGAAVEMTPGHPDNKNQQFNWSEVAASGIRPEDIPPAPVEDWTRYRKAVMRASILNGDDPTQAQMQVTQMQMDGFSSNMQQAAFLAKQGDARGAALAARMAYQYFPNGSDVRFGIAEGKNGPVLVGMGTDEKTGEPVGEGTPMVLSADTLAMYADVARDPKQWLAWTKDWHAMDEKERRFLLDRDIAQVDARYKDRMAGAAETNAAAAQQRAANTGAAGGVKQSDYRASFEVLREGMYAGQIDDEDINRMTSLATLLRQRVPDQQQLSDDQIIEEVTKFYESDGDPSVLSPGVARILGLIEE